MTESQLQIAAMKWLRQQRGPNGLWLAFHVPNEGARGAREGATLQRKGVLAGVSDILIAEPYDNLCGVAIELKRPGQAPTTAQRLFLQAMQDRAWHVGIAESMDDVKALCTGLLNYCARNAR